MKDENIINTYVKAVLKELNCSKALASVFRKKFLWEIRDFAEEREGITYEALVDRFGAPSVIAAGFLDRPEYEALLKAAKRKVRVWMGIGLLAAVIAVIAILFCLHMYHHLGGTVTISDNYDS